MDKLSAKRAEFWPVGIVGKAVFYIELEMELFAAVVGVDVKFHWFTPSLVKVTSSGGICSPIITVFGRKVPLEKPGPVTMKISPWKKKVPISSGLNQSEVAESSESWSKTVARNRPSGTAWIVTSTFIASLPARQL